MSNEVEEIPETPVRWKILCSAMSEFCYFKRYAKTAEEAKEILKAQFDEWTEKYNLPSYTILNCERDKTKTVSE